MNTFSLRSGSLFPPLLVNIEGLANSIKKKSKGIQIGEVGGRVKLPLFTDDMFL